MRHQKSSGSLKARSHSVFETLWSRTARGRVGDPGYFSLAGARPKTALLFENGRWGVPSGRIPTTHILKPPSQRDIVGFDVNEHYCMALAKELGLTVATSRVQWFDDQAAIVVERYDRVRSLQGRILRVHQQDICQALSVPPWQKYEAEGGPGAANLTELLLNVADNPDHDVRVLLDALALNWAIGGTDAHAKNYSLLVRPGSIQLAPLYDLASVLPYPNAILYRKARMAMHIGREYHLGKVTASHWREMALNCQLDESPVVARVSELVAAVPAAAAVAADHVAAEGIQSPMVKILKARISSHAEMCLRQLDRNCTSKGMTASSSSER